jgi:RNA 2',3'-cyclic 3'-phosphodiesterase
MNDRSWRCFWAVPLPDGLRSALADAVAEMRADPDGGADWRWTEPAGWHLTLAFLGAVPEAAIPSLVASVGDAVRDQEPFAVATGGLGGFPSDRRTRVLWYGVSDSERRLRALARNIADASGLVEPGPFRAHVTLARSRDRRGSAPPVPPAGGLPEGLVEVGALTLFRSHLGPGPARYEALAVVPMASTLVAVAT